MPDEIKYTGSVKKLREKLDSLKKQERGTKEHSTVLNDLRQILKKQNKRQKATSTVESIVFMRDIPRQTPNRHSPDYYSPNIYSPNVYNPLPEPEFSGKILYLDDAVKGNPQTHQRYGNSFLVSTRLSGYNDSVQMTGAVSKTFRQHLSSPESVLFRKIAKSCGLENPDIKDFIFMDIETTGLNSSPLFLIGIMIWDGDDFVVRQYFARDYSEEASVISFFLDICSEKRVLVTFNGKSFDLPYIRNRAIANGIPYSISPLHYDLLHESRRAWKGRLPNCKLQTIETYVCGRPRYGDIPGSMIPDAYHSFVRTQDAREMAEVLKHNFLDLVTMADIMTRFPEDRE